MNIYYDVEDNHYRTYPDGDIATIDQMRELIEDKNLSVVKLQQENKQLKDNWNMLKQHLTNRYNNGTESISYRQVFIEIREAMQVLEIQQELEQRRQELEKGSDK